MSKPNFALFCDRASNRWSYQNKGDFCKWHTAAHDQTISSDAASTHCDNLS